MQNLNNIVIQLSMTGTNEATVAAAILRYALQNGTAVAEDGVLRLGVPAEHWALLASMPIHRELIKVGFVEVHFSQEATA